MKILESWTYQVSQAAINFESRWTLAVLRRVNADLAERLHDQRNRFFEACIRGADADIVEEGAALVRGYLIVIAALEAANEPDDVYMLGTDLVTGLKVAIGQQKAAINRVREIHGQDVLWLTPDECARMLAGVESFKFVGAVKKLFPGAEIIDRYESEGSLAPADDESEAE
jgi:hypothetical protein